MGKERASSEQAWTDVLERERGVSGGGESSPPSRFGVWPIWRNGPFLGPQQLGRAPEAFLAGRLRARTHTHTHTEQFSSSPIPSDMELFLNSEHISGFSLREGGKGPAPKTNP